jgi:hypothetical protein
MKVDVDEPIRNINGEPAQENGKILLSKDILLTACLSPLESDRHQQGLAYRLYTLAHKLKDGGILDFEAADASFLQQRVEAVGFPPLVVGQLTDLLNARSLQL